jgi:hypothetical protein
MNERVNRPAVLVVAMVVIGGAILAPILVGGRVSTILSTVGNAVTTGSGSDDGGATAPEPGSGSGSGSGAAAGGGGQVADAAAVVPALLIVRTGKLELEVADLGAAVRDGDAAVFAAGGYVSGSTRTTSGGVETAEATYRIPSPQWAATLDRLHGLARRVAAERIETEEVTGRVVDLTARIANLRATEAALQAIMAKATKISEILDVQKQLTATRGEVEQLVAQKTLLEEQASFGSLTVTYRLPPAVTPTATPRPTRGWDPGADAARATAQLVRVGQRGASAGIWLAIVGLPLLLAGTVLVVVGWGLGRLVRRVMRRRAAVLDTPG